MSKYSNIQPSEYERLDDELSDKIRSCQTINELKEFYEVSSKMNKSDPEYSQSFLSLTIRAKSIIWGKAAQIDSIRSFNEISELLEFIQQLIQHSYNIEMSRDILIDCILDRIDLEFDKEEDVQESHEITEIIQDMVKESNSTLFNYSKEIKEKLNTKQPYKPSMMFRDKQSPQVRVVPTVEQEFIVRGVKKFGNFNENFGVDVYIGSYKGDQVAIKTYNYTRDIPENKKNEIENEIRCLETLGTGLSPYIVNYRGSWLGNNEINIMMDYYPKSLKQLIMDGGTTKFEDFTRLVSQMLSAFTVMQNNNIHHGDIKPDNIMIDNQGNIRIIDFGFSVIRVEPSFSSSISQGITITGTAGYLAPELKNITIDEKNLAKYRRGKADVFSLGITFIKMLKGYDWNYSIDTLENEINTIQAEFRGFISSMVEKDPKKRKSFKDLRGYFEVAITQ